MFKTKEVNCDNGNFFKLMVYTFLHSRVYTILIYCKLYYMLYNHEWLYNINTILYYII